MRSNIIFFYSAFYFGCSTGPGQVFIVYARFDLSSSYNNNDTNDKKLYYVKIIKKKAYETM